MACLRFGQERDAVGSGCLCDCMLGYEVHKFLTFIVLFRTLSLSHAGLAWPILLQRLRGKLEDAGFMRQRNL